MHRRKQPVSGKKVSWSSLITHRYRETTKITCLLAADPSPLVVDASCAFSYCHWWFWFSREVSCRSPSPLSTEGLTAASCSYSPRVKVDPKSSIMLKNPKQTKPGNVCLNYSSWLSTVRLSIVQQCAPAGKMMDLFGENHADAVEWAQHRGQGYTCFLFPPELQTLAAIQNYGCLARTVPIGVIILYFFIHIFALQGWIYVLWFPVCFQLFSLTNSLCSQQHCLLISILHLL